VSVVVPEVVPGALTVTVAGPSAPATEGLKVAVNVHVLPGRTTVVHALMTAKSAAFVPLTAIAGTPDAALPVLATVNDCALLVVPSVREPKSWEAGITENALVPAGLSVPTSAALAESLAPVASLVAITSLAPVASRGLPLSSTVALSKSTGPDSNPASAELPALGDEKHAAAPRARSANVPIRAPSPCTVIVVLPKRLTWEAYQSRNHNQACVSPGRATRATAAGAPALRCVRDAADP
jgi:hypothetical protein